MRWPSCSVVLIAVPTALNVTLTRVVLVLQARVRGAAVIRDGQAAAAVSGPSDGKRAAEKGEGRGHGRWGAPKGSLETVILSFALPSFFRSSSDCKTCTDGFVLVDCL